MLRVLLLALAVVGLPAWSQAFPSKTVRISCVRELTEVLRA